MSAKVATRGEVNIRAIFVNAYGSVRHDEDFQKFVDTHFILNVCDGSAVHKYLHKSKNADLRMLNYLSGQNHRPLRWAFVFPRFFSNRGLSCALSNNGS